MAVQRMTDLRRAFGLAAAVLAIGLAGCEAGFFSKPAPPGPCPRVAAVADAGTLTRFSGSGRDLTDVAFEAEIGGMQGSCVYSDDVIDVDLAVQFIASRGPADQNRRADFKYFVAVARFDQSVVARESFDTFVEFPGNQNRAGIVEELAQHIPIASGERGDSFVIYVGFELTPQELTFNRAQK